jgi:hypothetical protein
VPCDALMQASSFLQAMVNFPRIKVGPKRHSALSSDQIRLDQWVRSHQGRLS